MPPRARSAAGTRHLASSTSSSVLGHRPPERGVGTAQGLEESEVPPVAVPEHVKWRLRYLVVCAILSALAFNSAGGQTSPDTKLDLVVNPGGFLHRALTLWDPNGFGGQLQNQAYGYLFPMGPFFWIGHLLRVAPWIVERLWWSSLLSAAFLGVVVLARLLGIGNRWTQILAGSAYATSPHVLSIVGSNSVEILPMCVAPWMVAAVVAGSRSGSPRRYGLLAGVPVLFMGGVNAAVVLAAILPAALWLLTRRPDARSLLLTAWTTVGVLLATLWWIVPLLVLGKYSPPFLNYIENSSITTSTTSLIESLRGTADWVSYISPGSRGGFSLLTDRVLVLNSVLVVAIGLAGLAARRTPHRLWLVACLSVGLVALTFGHGASIGSLNAVGERALLDGALAPLRNVHKFDLLIRLPLVLAMAHLTSMMRWGTTHVERRASNAVITLISAVAVLATAAPLLGFGLAPAGSYTALPDYWKQAAGWLNSHETAGRALEVPASRFADYQWGTLSDEPLQPLSKVPWEVRNAIPLVPAGHIRTLDTIEHDLASGRGSFGLSTYLERSGIRYLVVRNDLNYAAEATLAPNIVHATLLTSPGIERVAQFGPTIGSPGSLSVTTDQGLQGSYAAVEIWQVGGPPAPPVATTTGLGSVVQLSGGPETIPQLVSSAVLSASQPTILTTDGGQLARGGTILTDGLRRREINFGGAVGVSSPTLTTDDTKRLGASVLDYLPPGATSASHQSVAEYVGATDVTASSSAADVTSRLVPNASEQPFSAFDDDDATAWVSAPGDAPVGQWVQATFGAPRVMSTATIALTDIGRQITSVRVTSDHGFRDTAVRPTTQPQTLRVPPGPTLSLRVTVRGVSSADGSSDGVLNAVGIADIGLAGVSISRTIVVPNDLPSRTAPSAVSFAVPPDARSGCLLLGATSQCVAGLDVAGEEAAGIDRTFTTGAGARYTTSATVTPRAGRSLDGLIAQYGRFPVEAIGSTDAVADPLGAGQAAADGDLTTGWSASSSDPDPTLTLHWSKTVAVRSVRIATDPNSTRPDVVRITSPNGERSGFVAPDGKVTFPALRTNQLSLHFTSSAGLRRNIDLSGTGVDVLGIGVAEVTIANVPKATPKQSDARPVLLPCGAGPVVQLDGVNHQTQIVTTVQKLREMTAVPLLLCGSPLVRMDAGRHRLRVTSTADFSATSVTLAQPSAIARAGQSVRGTVGTSVVTWHADHRVLAVAPRTTESLVTVDENANAGWQATVNGRPLRSVTVDGWKQGYVIPAGAAAFVVLDFRPQFTYSLGLGGGAAAVLVLLVLLSIPARPGRRRAGARGIELTGPVGAALAMLVGWLCGARAGLVTGVVVVVVFSLLNLGVKRWRPHGGEAAIAAAGAGVFLAAGLVLVRSPWGSAHYAGNTGGVQVMCLVAVTMVVAAPLVSGGWRLHPTPGAAAAEADLGAGRAEAAPSSTQRPEPTDAGA